MSSNANTLEQRIIQCTGCSRLREYCQDIAQTKKRMYMDWEYWGKPVPNFGDPQAELVIVGLAPAAHGANRTGRMFTGDQSGVWLYRALHRAGFANQAESIGRDDSLKLDNCLITAVCHCAPPDNKPTPEEIKQCSGFLQETLKSAERKKVILALGQIAWKNTLAILQAEALLPRDKRKDFAHGAEIQITDQLTILASYHPSQQNTFTGKLTEQAFDDVFNRCREIIGSRGRD